jgi:hypothetical protein
MRRRMIHFFKFRADLYDPEPAKDVYVKRAAGRGWPEECPPIRAANAFGFDLLANFDVTFVNDGDAWRVKAPVSISSDFAWGEAERTLSQEYAWFWDQGQTIPHPISDHVYAEIRHQVKVSTFLYLRTDPNEQLLITDLPNQPRERRWRALSALVETDWYPASYPWHCVLELDPAAEEVSIARGEPLCRVMPARRDTYFARPMSPVEFDDFYMRGQRWLETHGRPPSQHEAPPPKKKGKKKVAAPEPDPGTLDITRTYSRQQLRSRFTVIT